MTPNLALDRLIAELAARYDGLVPTSELYAAGHCREAIGNRMKANTLAGVAVGVRRLGNVELTPARRAMAAALVLPDSWVSHTSALAVFGATQKANSLKSEISSPHHYRPPGIRAHRRAIPSKANLRSYFEIPVSQPWWAVIESASVLNENELAVAMDSLFQSKSISWKRLQRAHDEAGKYRGRPMLAYLLNERLNGQGIVRSFLEQDLSRLLKQHLLPTPVRNFEVILPNARKRVLDVAWPAVRCGLEAQSWKHHSNPSDWGRTMVRDRGLTVIGWSILPVVVADTRDPTSLIAGLHELFFRVSHT